MTRALDDDNATIWGRVARRQQAVKNTTKRTEHALPIGHNQFVITQHRSFTVDA
ncbi:hypothetical protein [Streptomyces puniciscabiei]|uniref:hypothetical protein n=1 Tax=Streptomyces puniciscabiei TaxID=164348 RepID=UPI00131D8DEF|nr:hypothetical protein [Streptomyces puniciscabiei]